MKRITAKDMHLFLQSQGNDLIDRIRRLAMHQKVLLFSVCVLWKNRTKKSSPVTIEMMKKEFVMWVLEN
jgi:hypothetical protein